MSSAHPLDAAEPEDPNLNDAPPPKPRAILRLPQRPPLVVYALLAITVVVYLAQTLTGLGLLQVAGLRCPYFNSPDLPACYGLKVNELIIEGQWWRLVTPILLHASLLHIGFNMYALYVLGPELESHFGHFPFLALYVLSGFAGVVLSFLMTESPSLGASTAIFGLLAAQGVFAYRNQRVFGRRARAALRSIINIALINFLIGLTPGIDNWGHFGGLLGGLIFAGMAAPSYEISAEGAELRLANRTAPSRTILACIAVVLVFSGLAFWRVRQ